MAAKPRLVVYKVLKRFTDYNGDAHRIGVYVLLDPIKVRQKYRRGCLLLARDQEGAKKIVGYPDPRKFHGEKKEHEDNLVLSRAMHKQKQKEAKLKPKKVNKDVKKS